MSWEEDYLLRRVDEMAAALKGAGVLHECEECTTLYAADLDACPNCGHPKGEPQSAAMAGERPTPLGGVESTAGANALPPETVHGGADPNAVRAASEESEQDDDTDGEPEERPVDADTSGAPEETIDGEETPYQDANVETLRAEVKRRGDRVFVPSSANKAALIDALRRDDRVQAEQTAREA